MTSSSKLARLIVLVLTTAVGAAAAQEFVPAVVFDMGGKFDKSFNEAAYTGAERFKKETGIAYRDFEVTNEAQREQALRNMARRGAQIVVGIGFAQASGIEKVAKEFPEVSYDEMMIDSIAMKLVVAPQQFDVVVTTNQFGDILTDIGAGLVGGLGLAPGLCIGEKQAMAQATHGSAPDIYGRNIANPYAMIMSGQMLLGWLGRKHNEPRASAAADSDVTAAAGRSAARAGGLAEASQAACTSHLPTSRVSSSVRADERRGGPTTTVRMAALSRSSRRR